ncbi:hypothetical protein EBR21_12215 [bacterium]|nr:hypothetical protein [bacterium]
MSKSMSPESPSDGRLDNNFQQTPSQAHPAGGMAFNPMYGYQNTSDEIDLVELLGFFWKIKLEIVLGVVVGVLGGAFVALKVLPVNYKTQIPLSLEKSEPALADPKKFVETFNASLNSAETARALWRSVLNQSPELGRVMRDANITDESLAASQALSANPEKSPLRLRESASPRDFILDITLPIQGLTSRSGDLFAAAIQHVVSGSATAENEKGSASGKIPATSANAAATAGAAGAAGGNALEPMDEFREQLLKAKQDYLKIEFLLNKLSRSLPEYASFMSSADADMKALHFSVTVAEGGVAEAQEQFVVQAQYERMQRLVALLLAEGRMKPDEARDTVQRAQQIRDEIFQLLPLARREAQKANATPGHKRTGGKDSARNSSPLAMMPTLVSASLNGAALTLEEPISKRKIALVLGAFLGAFAGFAIGGLRVFVKKNGNRLREVMAQ